MSIFVARQPIFDAKMKVFAYELLYRSSMINSFNNTDADMASSHVLLNSFCNIGLEKLTDDHNAFVNFTANLLKQDIATIFPKESLIIEILENVNPEKEIIDRCRELKKLGYRIALDDFVLRDDYLPFIELADIVKVDFLLSDDDEKMKIINLYRDRNIKFLAEKVETQRDFNKAREMGYTYFQGFFFSKPSILIGKEISNNKLSYLRIIESVNRDEIDFDEIAELVACDISLSYKLLKLANSAAFGLRSRIDSIRQALIVIGINEIRKIVSLVALQGIGEDKPDEILHISLIRAKYAELLAGNSDLKARKEECFLLGLFSVLDVLLDRPMEEAIKGIPLTEDIISALVKKEGVLGQLYHMILLQEQGNWVLCNAYANMIGLNESKFSDYYIEALKYASILN